MAAFESYIPKEQNVNFLRGYLTRDLGYVLVDVGDGFEQYCKCNHMKCLELFKALEKHSKAEEIKDGLTKFFKKRKSVDSSCRLIEPENRSLATLFRNKHHKHIGAGGNSGIDITYVDLIFTGDEQRHQELTEKIPQWKENEA